MISADVINFYFNINHRVIHMQIDGLTHEDSLLQPADRGNCLNWVLGHIVVGRCNALTLLGEEPVWSEEETLPYKRDSEPIVGADDAYRLEKIVADLDTTQERLAAALAGLETGDLERVVDDRTLGQRLAFLYWHEAYHAGQTEYLRQLSGKDDKVI